jgi:hypothetical protein
MAKMFYSLEEAAAKLGKSEAQVRGMAESGQLQEFRDRDRLMFKVEQVDLIAGDDGVIPLAESGELEPLSLASSGTSPGLAGLDAREATGISIFETEGTEEADPSAATVISPSMQPIGLADSGGLDRPGSSASGSGSGLMDLAREKDDTSLGAGLMDDVYGGDTQQSQTQEEPAMASGMGGDGGGLFETSAGAAGVTDVSPAAAMPAMAAFAEAYDGAGSGLVGGLALGATVALLLGLFVVVLRLVGVSVDLISNVAEPMILTAAAAGIVAVAGVVGWVLGRKG